MPSGREENMMSNSTKLVHRNDVEAAFAEKSNRKTLSVMRPCWMMQALGLDAIVTMPRSDWKAVREFFKANPQASMCEVQQ